MSEADNQNQIQNQDQIQDQLRVSADPETGIIPVILHVASITQSAFSGVNVVVPKHVVAQNDFAQTALVNIKNVNVEDRLAGVPLFPFAEDFRVADLPEPFNKPDLVVIHEVYHPEFVRIAKELRRAGIPYVVLPHGCLTHDAQAKKHLKKVAGNVAMFGSFIRHAVALQALSEAEMENTHFNVPLFVGENGVDIPEAQRTFVEGAGRDALRLTYVGRLDAVPKGLDLMIEAVRLAHAEMGAAHATLDLYGPDYQGRFAHVAELIENAGVGDVVALHHEIAGDEKRTLLMNTDIFIQTSRAEGMPVGLLEASSLGLPLLVTEGTNVAEGVARWNAGWTAETSAESIAQALRMALTEASQPGVLAEKGKNGRAWVTSDFAWPKIAGKTVAAYLKLIENE